MTARDQLQAFFYILLRDHLRFGQVETILAGHVEKAAVSYSFSEPVIAEYAGTLADRLLRIPGPMPEIVVGEIYEWEPHKPHARCRCKVTRIEDVPVSTERRIWTIDVDNPDEQAVMNDEGRFREACDLLPKRG